MSSLDFLITEELFTRSFYVITLLLQATGGVLIYRVYKLVKTRNLKLRYLMPLLFIPEGKGNQAAPQLYTLLVIAGVLFTFAVITQAVSDFLPYGDAIHSVALFFVALTMVWFIRGLHKAVMRLPGR